MRRKTRKQYLELFDRDLRSVIDAQLNEPETTAAVGFETPHLEPSRGGRRSHLPVGPPWTLKTLEDTGAAAPGRRGRPIENPPGTEQFPTFYWIKPIAEEDVQWEAAQDEWDQTHPLYSPMSRDDEAADRFTQERLASWQSINERK